MAPMTLIYIISILAGLSTAIAIYFFLLWRKAEASSLSSQAFLSANQEMLGKLERMRDEAVAHREQEHRIRIESETKVQLTLQEMELLKRQMSDWEKTKEESLKAAKVAMFETGSTIFRQEAELVNKNTLAQFNKMVESVSTLHDRMHKNENTLSTLWRSLSAPTSAGSFSEINLENTLRSYGLEAGRDFIMQYSVQDKTGAQLRPDAVVFLPAGNALVIDSKASKFFLDAAIAEGEEEKEISAKLIRRMQEHLKNLTAKNYRDAVREFSVQTGRGKELHHIHTVMFIQAESQIEKVFSLDGEFRGKCMANDVIPTGPTGLCGLLSAARFHITQEQKEKNYENIMAGIGSLLDSIRSTLEHISTLGRGLKQAAGSYQKLTGSINQNMLPKARRLQSLGLTLPQNKTLPQRLTSYSLVSEEETLIEAEPVDEIKELESV